METEKCFFIFGDNGSYFYAEFADGGSVEIDTVIGEVLVDDRHPELPNWTYDQWDKWKNETDEVWGRMFNMPVAELPWYNDEFNENWLYAHVGASVQF